MSKGPISPNSPTRVVATYHVVLKKQFSLAFILILNKTGGCNDRGQRLNDYLGEREILEIETNLRT